MTPRSPQAFSPGSATLIFLPVVGDTVMETFAKGSAIALTDGVTAAVRPAKASRVLLNGATVDLPPVHGVLTQIAPESLEVSLETSLPLGCGFGVSAAASLTTAFAIARRFDLELSREELAIIAHTAEVTSGTGIGDVATQLSGGIVYRRGERGPFDCLRMPIDAPPLHYCNFGPISTKETLKDPKFQITLAREGERGVQWLHAQHATASLADLLDRALEFAEKTELLTAEPVRRAVDRVRAIHGHATMVMLGQSVIATLPTDDDVAWTSCRVDQEGTRWL